MVLHIKSYFSSELFLAVWNLLQLGGCSKQGIFVLKTSVYQLVKAATYWSIKITLHHQCKRITRTRQIVLEHCRKSSPNVKKKPTQTRNEEQMVIRNSFNGKAHFNHPLSFSPPHGPRRPELHKPANKIIPFANIFVPHGNINNSTSFFIQVKVKLLPPLRIQSFWNNLKGEQKESCIMLHRHTLS